ncbi:succinyl-CoA synthetase subunit beta [Jannaschia formosa]|nr:succinyl-CoA synthetase subunit beta [Jannaschia formosa]
MAAANPLRAAALDAFARNCFSPHLTARAAEAELAPHGRHDFYDLRPFSAPAPSKPATEATPGTDRRCEIAFDGAHGEAAAEIALAALQAEGIRAEAPLPLPARPDETTTLRGARFLNPARIAVVETGTRPGPNGTETFLRVERLTPEASAEAIR